VCHLRLARQGASRSTARQGNEFSPALSASSNTPVRPSEGKAARRRGAHVRRQCSRHSPTAFRTPQKVNPSAARERRQQQAGLRARKLSFRTDVSPSQEARSSCFQDHVTFPVTDCSSSNPETPALAYRCGGSRGVAVNRPRTPFPFNAPPSQQRRTCCNDFQSKLRVHRYTDRPKTATTIDVRQPCRVFHSAFFHASRRRRENSR